MTFSRPLPGDLGLRKTSRARTKAQEAENETACRGMPYSPSPADCLFENAEPREATAEQLCDPPLTSQQKPLTPSPTCSIIPFQENTARAETAFFSTNLNHPGTFPERCSQRGQYSLRCFKSLPKPGPPSRADITPGPIQAGFFFAPWEAPPATHPAAAAPPRRRFP